LPENSGRFAIGVAQFSFRNFATLADIPLQTWVYHQERENGITVFDKPAFRALEFYRDHIGPYPYEKLASVEAAGISGGTEHASAIFYGQQSVQDKPATNLVAHEIAHQWFGNAVTEKDWDDVWLSEGFATYFTLLCTEHDDGRDVPGSLESIQLNKKHQVFEIICGENPSALILDPETRVLMKAHFTRK
jgi:aminopeptidase N